MIRKIYLLLSFCLLALTGCKKEAVGYPEGYDTIYYAFFDYESDELGNPTLSSTTLNLDKSSRDNSSLRIKFMSSKEQDFDVEVRLYLRNQHWFLEKINAARTPGMFTTPDSLAVHGLDYELLDENLNAISPVRADSLSYYSIVFPKARKDTRQLYIRPLDNQDYSCPRYVWLSLALTHPAYDDEESVKTNTVNHYAADYQVNTIVRSWLRTIIIK